MCYKKQYANGLNSHPLIKYISVYSVGKILVLWCLLWLWLWWYKNTIQYNTIQYLWLCKECWQFFQHLLQIRKHCQVHFLHSALHLSVPKIFSLSLPLYQSPALQPSHQMIPYEQFEMTVPSFAWLLHLAARI